MVRAVRRWHVLGHRRVHPAPIAARVRGHAYPALEDFHGRRRQSYVELLADELVRHRVVVMVDLDVVVDRDPRGLPIAVVVSLVGKRLECRLVEALEELAAARAVNPHRPVVELLE